MNGRYSKVLNKVPRETLLLQGRGCVWGNCSFCDYHKDFSENPFEVNKDVLENVTGEFGTLDILNSGSAMELDDMTIDLIKEKVKEKKIRTLWFEAHYLYREILDKYAKQFKNTEVKFRCGVETFNAKRREMWNKGMPVEASPEEIAKYFKGISLLCGVRGQTKEEIIYDIETAKNHFEYFSVNIFSENSTEIKKDRELADWFIEELYPLYKDDNQLEILFENTDLGLKYTHFLERE